MYVLAGVYGIVFGASPDGVVGGFAHNPALFYLVGRLVTALFGTATLAVLYFTGRMAYGPAVGILAAALLAVDLLHVRDSHWVTPDVPLTLLVALATFYALRYWRDGGRANACAAGLVAGLAAAMKYPGGLAFLGLVAAHAARRPGLPAWRRVAGKEMILAAGLAVVGFLLGTPFALLTPAAFVQGVLAEVREVYTVQFGNEADASGYLFHLAYSLPVAMSWPVYLLALAGLAWALAVRGAREVVLLAFAVPYLLVIVTWSSRFERYAIPLLPCLTLLAAVAVVRGVGWLSERWRLARAPWPAIALVSAAVLLVAPALARVVAYHRLLAQPDTRELGSGWIERHVAAGSTDRAASPTACRCRWPDVRPGRSREAGPCSRRVRWASRRSRLAAEAGTGSCGRTRTTSTGCWEMESSTSSCRGSSISATARPAIGIRLRAGSTPSSTRGHSSSSAPRPAWRTPPSGSATSTRPSPGFSSAATRALRSGSTVSAAEGRA